MTPSVSKYLNKTILVSIPALFEDGKCRRFVLAGAEANGLWLRSEELAERLLPEDMVAFASTTPIVFIPFAQIGGVVVVAGVPETATRSRTPTPD